jgi:hypothetical protein
VSSLREFKQQRSKVAVPRRASTRRLRRALERRVRLAGQPRTFQGVVARDERALLMRSVRTLHERHANVMDPYRLPEYRHPQARRLERIARRIAYEVGWRIEFDSAGVMRIIG